jgi:monooxygenase
MARRPLLDFSAGYVLRSIDEFPRAGDRAPWRLGMSYFHDYFTLRHRPVNDGVMRFTRLARPARTAGTPAAGGGGEGTDAALAGAVHTVNLGN